MRGPKSTQAGMLARGRDSIAPRVTLAKSAAEREETSVAFLDRCQVVAGINESR